MKRGTTSGEDHTSTLWWEKAGSKRIHVEWLRRGEALMAVSAAGGAGAAHVSEALVEEAEGAFASNPKKSARLVFRFGEAKGNMKNG